MRHASERMANAVPGEAPTDELWWWGSQLTGAKPVVYRGRNQENRTGYGRWRCEYRSHVKSFDTWHEAIGEALKREEANGSHQESLDLCGLSIWREVDASLARRHS